MKMSLHNFNHAKYVILQFCELTASANEGGGGGEHGEESEDDLEHF
jgi:hypothetical protein